MGKNTRDVSKDIGIISRYFKIFTYSMILLGHPNSVLWPFTVAENPGGIH